MKHKTIIYSLSSLLLLSGCSFAPKLEVPQVEAPASVEALQVEEKWWKVFGDEQLNILIEEVLKNSDDLRLSALKVLRARQIYGLSDANLYPTLNANANASRQKTSAEVSPYKSKEFSDHSLGLTLQYEIDFWGKLANQKEANWSSYLATKASARIVKNSLIHESVLAYVNLATLEDKLNVVNETIKSYEQSYDYRLKQYNAGVINELVLNQATAQLSNTKALKVSLLEAKELQISALRLLLPKEYFEGESALKANMLNSLSIPKGIPSNILENRPDVYEALENLKAKNALIGVEKASYFPSISLTGSYGLQSEELGNILQSSANRWFFGPSLNVPIFDFDRIKTKVSISETDLKSAAVSYEYTIKKAYKEVYDAIAKQNGAKSRSVFQDEEYNAFKKSLDIVTKRFDSGVSSYLEVLDAQRGTLNAKLSVISSKQALLNAQAEFFRALGGGWKPEMLKNEAL